MKKISFIAPVIALIVFICFYSVHQKGAKQREADRVARVEAELKAKNEAEQLARQTAMAEAIKAAELRKREKEAREAREKADKEVRQVALDARDKAFREHDKINRQIERLKKDIEAEEAVLAKLAAERKAAEAERAFILELNAKAQLNVKSLQTVLTNLGAKAPAPLASASK